MPNFAPAGIVHIGRVPFDDSYKHTIDCFSSPSGQASVMQGFCTQALSRSDYTYVRMNNSIRIEGNAEGYYTYNYVMYQNANYGTKWFYAFITAVNYVNDNVTELQLELDVLQTWWFDWTLEECFVEREHVSSDGIGEHTNPEPEMPFNLTSNGRYTDTDMYSRMVILQTNAWPHYINENQVFGSDAVSGGWYQRSYSGCKLYAFTYGEATGGDSVLNEILDNMNRTGAAESITGLYTIPSMFVPNVGGDHGVQSETVPTGTVKFTSRPSSLDGYVPRNNKLFTYPYCFARFTDNNGGSVDLKYELWGTNEAGNCSYVVESAIDPSAKAVVVPQVYGGVQRNYDQALVFPVTSQCSWPFSSYQTWLAQNALANTVSLVTNVAMFAVPAARGLGAAAKAWDVGVGSGMRIIARGGTPASAARLGGASLAHGFNSLSTAEKAAAGIGAMGLSSLAGEVYRQSTIPNVAKGQCSANTLAQLNMQTYNVDQMTVTAEYAAIIDGFLDMYGYQVDAVKKPNMSGRASWNYVKCQNSANHGNVPASDMAEINSILDSGLTVWHTVDVGNYSLSNGIV